jgi:hypothetical protein
LFLSQFITELTSFGYYPVIFSTRQIWTELFAGVACTSFAQDLSVQLVYAIYGSDGEIIPNSNIDDLIPFGGWSFDNGNVGGKQFMGNVTVPLNCGATPWHAFLDEYSFPAGPA